MILSNIEIHKALDEGRLVIKPEPTPRLPSIEEPHCPYDTHTVDLRLGTEISVPHEGPLFSYNLTEPGSLAKTINDNSKKVHLSHDQPFHLRPKRFILAQTLEFVKLPILQDRDTCLAARIEGKSSRARIGMLIHFTAPTVHPGFYGTLTLEVINLGQAPVLLIPEMPIAQLIVEEVKGIPQKNPSQFEGQRTPTGLSES